MLSFIVPYLPFLNLFQALRFVFLCYFSYVFSDDETEVSLNNTRGPWGFRLVCFPSRLLLWLNYGSRGILVPLWNRRSPEFKSLIPNHTCLIINNFAFPNSFLFLWFHDLITGVNRLFYLRVANSIHKCLQHCIIFRSSFL